jgi:hypothetical protein
MNCNLDVRHCGEGRTDTGGYAQVMYHPENREGGKEKRMTMLSQQLKHPFQQITTLTRSTIKLMFDAINGQIEPALPLSDLLIVPLFSY